MNWYKIDLDINNALLPNVLSIDALDTLAPTNTPYDNLKVWKIAVDRMQDVFNAEWLDKMRQQGMAMDIALIFYRPAFYQHPEAHIDVDAKNPNLGAAINWTLDAADDSEMVWYNTPESTNETELTPAGTAFYSWPLEQLTEIGRHCVGNTPSLVQIDIPHTVLMNSKARWSISVRTKQRFADWKEVTDYFAALGMINLSSN